jgi:hypothetical protein
MFNTIYANTKHSDDGSLFIYLGTKKIANVKRSLSFTVVTKEVVQAIKRIPIHDLRDGVTVVINLDNYVRDKQFVDAIQKHLAMTYCKYVLFPRQSDTIPDLAGVRNRDGRILIPREIQRAENIHLYLRSPLCNKLKGLGKAMPVAILLPGPSLKKAAPLLNELKKKCLIICVPRTVEFCRQAGVEPDFVVSLDTIAYMQHWVRPSKPFPNTYLVALSPGALAKPAQCYRGLFLMESFDTSILPRAYRLRESWLSCSISALGLAELLESQLVFLVGGDHSWEGQGATGGGYWNSKQTLRDRHGEVDNPLPQPPKCNEHLGPAMVKDLEEWTCRDIPNDARMHTQSTDASMPGLPDNYAAFTLADRSGKQVQTFFHYYAISAELEQVAQEMAIQVGTTCYLLEGCGILSADIFKEGGLEKLQTLCPIDRERFLASVDVVHSRKERIDYAAYADSLDELANAVDRHSAFLSFCYHDGKIKEVMQHPYVQSIDNASAQRKISSVRDYKIRVKYDCNYSFYEFQLNKLDTDLQEFSLLKKEFYEARIEQCKTKITKDNFEQLRGSLFSEDEAHVVKTTIRACEAWRNRLEEGIALCRIYQGMAKKSAIVLWCLPEEKTPLLKVLTRSLGKFTPHFVTIPMQEEVSTGKLLEYVYIDDFLLFADASEHAQVAGWGFQKKYGYLLDLVDKKKVIPVQAVVGRDEE